jgi:hypothetical protein
MQKMVGAAGSFAAAEAGSAVSTVGSRRLAELCSEFQVNAQKLLGTGVRTGVMKISFTRLEEQFFLDLGYLKPQSGTGIGTTHDGSNDTSWTFSRHACEILMKRAEIKDQSNAVKDEGHFIIFPCVAAKFPVDPDSPIRLEEGELEEGDTVVLHGLDTVQLNGKFATLKRYDREDKRWLVEFYDGSADLKVRPKNLDRLIEVGEHVYGMAPCPTQCLRVVLEDLRILSPAISTKNFIPWLRMDRISDKMLHTLILNNIGRLSLNEQILFECCEKCGVLSKWTLICTLCKVMLHGYGDQELQPREYTDLEIVLLYRLKCVDMSGAHVHAADLDKLQEKMGEVFATPPPLTWLMEDEQRSASEIAHEHRRTNPFLLCMLYDLYLKTRRRSLGSLGMRVNLSSAGLQYCSSHCRRSVRTQRSKRRLSAWQEARGCRCFVSWTRKKSCETAF